MRKIREVVRLHEDRKASVREIARACGIGRSTVDEYLHRAKAAGLCWPLPEGLSDADLESLLFPPRPEPGEPPRPLPDWSVVHRELGRQKGMTLLLLWEEYKSKFPNGYGYSRYAALYRDWEQRSDVRMLQRHKAGEKVFTDWAGLKMKIANPKTGEIWEAPVFVAGLGLSQFIFARAYESEELRWWLAGHVDAIEFYGAVPEIVVPDNLKTGVAKPCRYEPALNPSYAEWARFYEVAVLPARVRKPRDKAKVENAVQQVERWVLARLRDRTFFSLDEANQALAGELARLNERGMKGPNLSRKQLFEQEDRPAMRPLPGARYTYAEWKRLKVGPDYHVQADGHLYSVPFTFVARHVDVRIGVGTVEVFFGGKRIASHMRSLSRRDPVTLPEHMPERHRRNAEWTPERMVRWAGVVGPDAAEFVQRLLSGLVHPEQGFRRCMGVVSLEKRFGKERVNLACAKAVSLGAFSYHSVKSILEKNLEAVPGQESLPSLGTHVNVRGGEYYANEEAVPCAN
jgi:transposase